MPVTTNPKFLKRYIHPLDEFAKRRAKAADEIYDALDRYHGGKPIGYDEIAGILMEYSETILRCLEHGHKLICAKCGHVWNGGDEPPARCANPDCRSPTWDDPTAKRRNMAPKKLR